MVQNMKTEPLEDAGDLPDLTDKQMSFVMAVMAGNELVRAYEEAGYSVKGRSRNAVYVDASRLRANPKISLWLSMMKRQHFQQGLYTQEAHMLELSAAIEECKAAGNLGAMVNAIKAKGQVAGHYVALHEDLTKRNRSPAEMIEEVRTKLGADVADKLAKAMGVETLRKTA